MHTLKLQTYLLALLTLPAGAAIAYRAPEAVRGTLDLSSWSPQADGPVRLDGEWGFFWLRLVEPGDRSLGSPPAFARVPGTWNENEAYATYHQSYVESVWWSLKQLFDRGLLYQGHKIVWWWAQGGTALSAGEVGQDRKSVV